MGRRVRAGALFLLAATATLTVGAAPASAATTIGLSTSATSLAVSQSVTLKATSTTAATSTQPLQVFDTTASQVVASCSSGTTCSATTTQAASTTHSYLGRMLTSTGSVLASSTAVSVTWSDPVVAAAGDIACDPSDANFSGTNPSYCQMAATADDITQLRPNYLMPLGDEQYSNNASQGQPPTVTQYTNGYGASWGKLTTGLPGLVVRPIPGNHDWGDVNETDAEPPTLSASSYFNYFAPDLPAGTSASKDWYSFDIPVTGGTWHVVNLDSECGAVGGCGSGSAEETWLRNDLSAHAGQCILADWHAPRWSSGELGSNSTYSAFWNDLYNAHVAVALAGHDHSYEHLAARDASGALTSTGVTEFVVGTGGKDLGSWSSSPLVGTVYRQNGAFGALALTLHAGQASYTYRTTSGSTPDIGSLNCPGVATSASVPAVSSVSPISGPAAGGTSVTITGSNLSGATGVMFGTTPATSFTVNSSTSITAVAPALSSTVDITVANSSGTSAATVNDEWTPIFANGGYGVTLAASNTAPAVGTSVTLTATANQDVCPTPYGISIMDATTGVEVAHTGCGTTLSTTVTYTSVTTHRYVGLISNSGGANAQADSQPVVVSWS